MAIRLNKIAALVAVIFVCLIQTGIVQALSEQQRSLYAQGINYFDVSAGSNCSATTSSISVPAGTLPSFIPEPYNGSFTQGANAHNVAPALVAAIFSEEHNLGASETSPNTANLPAAWAGFAKQQPDPNSGWAYSKTPNDGTEVWADGEIGAGGPFQFEPTTWRSLGYNDADRDHIVTAADAAAKYLASNGGTKDQPESSWRTAIYDYNHADWYVNSVITYYNSYNSQPGNNGGGGLATVVTSSSSSCGSACSAVSSAVDGSKTIVIDPGHAPAPGKADVDSASNMNVTDWENDPEMADMYQAAQAIQTQLTNDGYNVIITKSSLKAYVNLKQREDVANQANAALGVSLHSDPGSSVNQVYYPEVGNYRYLADGSKSVYTNASLAATDKADAAIMAKARSAAEGHTVTSESYSQFLGGSARIENTYGVPQGGNMLAADYFSKVPWVYNEHSQDGGHDKGGTDPATGNKENGKHVAPASLTTYEKGIVAGVEKIVPLNGPSGAPTGNTSSCAANCNSSDTATSNLSSVRQQVVCLAQQELNTWKAQPGYPTTPYAAQGFLKYSNGVYQEWCADFASWIYNQASYPFSGGLSGGWLIPSVSNIMTLGEQNGNFHWHPAGSGYTPKPGDLAIHGGDHVNIFISSDGSTSQYIGGDQGNGTTNTNYGTQNPPSSSIVSVDTTSGYYSEGITGYVSPD